MIMLYAISVPQNTRLLGTLIFMERTVMPELRKSDIVFQSNVLASILADQISEAVKPVSVKKRIQTQVRKRVDKMWGKDFLKTNSIVTTAAQLEMLEEAVKTAIHAARCVLKARGL